MAEKELEKSEQRLETRIISNICDLKILLSLHTDIGFISSMRSCIHSPEKVNPALLGKMALLCIHSSPVYCARATQSISDYQKHIFSQ